jgi:hypothetical protein
MITLVPSLAVLFVQLPLLLVWLTGMVLAIIYWKRHPRVSLLALIGMAGLFIATVIGSLISLWLPEIYDQTGFPGGMEQFALLMNIKTIAGSLLSAVLWVLVIAAIFGWRKKPEATQ